MDFENEDLNLGSDDFSLEDILAEYITDEPEVELTESEQKAKSIVVEALGETVAQAFASGAIKIEQKEPETAKIEEKAEEIVSPEKESENYASADFKKAEEAKKVKEAVRRTRPPRRKSFAETVMTPVLAVLASVAEKRHSIKFPDPYAIEVEEELPEMAANKAKRLYESSLRSFDIRAKVSLVICILLSYMTVAFTSFLPLGGMLGASSSAWALVSLIMLMTVMLAGLDVFTNGIKTLIEGRGSAETLVSLSCIFSILDAIMVASGSTSHGIPLTAVSAWSMYFAIYSNRSTCLAMVSNLGVMLQTRETPVAVTSQKDDEDKSNCIVKSEIPVKNFIRRSECADISEITYIVALPFILILALVLSMVVAITSENMSFLRVFSALIAVSASFTSLIAFSKPFADLAMRLRRHGAALAGYPGCEDVGEAKRFVILDKDLFPKGTVKMSNANIAPGESSEKIIVYTGSILSAAGIGCATEFRRLMERNGYAMKTVENLQPEEGGVSAEIDGNLVNIGSSTYLHLKNIHLPEKVTASTAIYTIVNGKLCGAFEMDYKATKSVKFALDMLLGDVGFPVFAVRDFNITPVLIRRKFQVATDEFEFPSCEERYRISGAVFDENAPVSGVIAKQGIGPIAELIIGARRLFKASRFLLYLSLITVVLGMALVLYLCTGETVPNSLSSTILLYMLIVAAPTLYVSYKIK